MGACAQDVVASHVASVDVGGDKRRASRAREAGKRTLRAGRRWETRGARSARAEAKETQADIVARASDQWRGRRRDRTDRFCFACERRR